jgi:hypothetical protein
VNLTEFRKEHGHAPIQLEEFAHLIIAELDEGDGAEADELINTALRFVEAKAVFEGAMIEGDLELG